MNMEELNYEPPMVDFIEIETEREFALSGGTEGYGENNGTWD